MHLCELTHYTLSPIGTGMGLTDFSFSLSAGEVCCVSTDSPDDARLFLKALATLVRPQSGRYVFNGGHLDFSDYRNLLFCKRNIGYVAFDTAMLSNRTLLQNLLFMRFYFENSLTLSLDEKTMDLCKAFGIHNKLEIPAAKLDPSDLRIAILIRELSKSPVMLLFERPEDFVGHEKFGLFAEILNEKIVSTVPVVLFSYNREFMEKYSTKSIHISAGTILHSPAEKT